MAQKPIAKPDDELYVKNAKILLRSARAAQAGLFTLPARLQAAGLTRASIQEAGAQLELDVLGAWARVAVDKAQRAAGAGAGGRPSRAKEIQAEYDALPEETRLALLSKSKNALYHELRRLIIEKTARPEYLGRDAMRAALQIRLAPRNRR
jgi:hypothetical protein